MKPAAWGRRHVTCGRPPRLLVEPAGGRLAGLYRRATMLYVVRRYSGGAVSPVAATDVGRPVPEPGDASELPPEAQVIMSVMGV